MYQKDKNFERYLLTWRKEEDIGEKSIVVGIYKSEFRR